jgi:hypothetical protein
MVKRKRTNNDLQNITQHIKGCLIDNLSVFLFGSILFVWNACVFEEELDNTKGVIKIRK